MGCRCVEIDIVFLYLLISLFPLHLMYDRDIILWFFVFYIFIFNDMILFYPTYLLFVYDTLDL